MQPLGPAGVQPDYQPTYDGALMPNNTLPVSFSGAVVTGGQKVGKRWLGCTYIRPPFVIPGFGEVEEM
jgi:hypothetical protein